MKNWIKKNKFNIIIIIAWAVISFSMIFFHENWRDEAQSWLIARDLNIHELFSQLKYEGHFMLWYLILMPFAKLGLPYITTNFISWFICLISVIIICFKSPFKIYQKILFIFSLPMIYLYPVISRCYCLIPLAISLLAWLYKDRHSKPILYILLIVLLANTHVIMLGMVGILLLEFYIDCLKTRKSNSSLQNKKYLISFIIAIILLFITALPLFNSLTANKTIGLNLENNDVSTTLIIINNIYSCLLANFLAVEIVIVAAFLIILYAQEYLKSVFKFLIIFAWQIIIYTCIYGYSIQRAGSLILIFMFFMWIEYDTVIKNTIIKKALQICFIIIMLSNFVYTVYYCKQEISQNYSSAYQVAEYINENTEENSIFITAKQPEFVSSIIPYVTNNSKFYYLQAEKYFTFVTWDETILINLDENYGIEDLREIFGENITIYYIYCVSYTYENISDYQFVNKLLDNDYMTSVFTSDTTYFSGEEFIIFKIEL